MIIAIRARQEAEKILSEGGTGRKPGSTHRNRLILGSLDARKSPLYFGTLFMFSDSKLRPSVHILGLNQAGNRRGTGGNSGEQVLIFGTTLENFVTNSTKYQPTFGQILAQAKHLNKSYTTF